MDKSKIYLDLSKCTEEEQKHLEKLAGFKISYIKRYPYLQIILSGWNQSDCTHLEGKTELTYPEFIKLFEGGEEEKEVQKLKKQIDLYKECFELFIPTDKWDEANEFLSINGNPLAKHLSRVQKEVEKKPKF